MLEPSFKLFLSFNSFGERITKQAQLNRSEALRIFRDWATAKDKKFANWEDAFAIACNGWIPEARPDVREYPRQPLTPRDKRVSIGLETD